MPITNFLLQPATGALQAAYRPIVFKVEATATGGGKTPPFVVCDIYLNEVYYKSMIRTAPEEIKANASVFVFDISDAAQEYLQPDIATVNNSELLTAPHMSAKVTCKFRASDVNAEGFTVEEGAIPKQATKFTAAVAGGGTASNTFFVINSALQHEDNQNLSSHLNAFKQGQWNNLAWPLTHRNKSFFCDESSDHFPLIYAGPCTETELVLHYRNRGSSEWQTATTGGSPAPCDQMAYTVEVIGKRVYIELAEALPAGHQVQYRYQLQNDTAWSGNQFTTAQSFYFDVTDAGDYNLEVIRFCSCCTSAAPLAQTFTIENVQEQNLAWRPKDPFCQQVVLAQDVYVQLELRNAQIEEKYYPNSSFYYQINYETTKELVAKFFSDPAMLVPLNVQQALKVFVLRHENSTDSSGNDKEFEEVRTFTINASGTEALLERVLTHRTIRNYDPNNRDRQTGYSEVDNTYTVYPSAKLIGGNTGLKSFATLEQYNTLTGSPTGVTKANAEGDADYVAPEADEMSCPSGAPVTQVQYGYSLEVMKVELRYGSTFLYAEPVSNTKGGGYLYVLYIPKDQAVAITVKARTLDNSNTSGKVTVTVFTEDNQSQGFSIPNNIETLIPGSFTGVKTLIISNY